MLQRTLSYSNTGSTASRSLSPGWGRTATGWVPGSWPSSARLGSASSSPAPGTGTATASAPSNAKAGRRGAARSAGPSGAAGGESAHSGGGAPVRSSPGSRLIVGGSWSWRPPARRQVDVCPPWWSGAWTGLACGAAPGDPEPRTRTGRLPAGRAATWPPPASRALRCSLRSVPRVPAGWPTAPLDPADGQAARRHRSPGAGEEQRPTSRQEARTVADHPWDPTPAGTC
jgi:hypothetical protein